MFLKIKIKIVWLGALSRTPRSVRQFGIFGHFLFPYSAQCDTARSQTRRSVILRRARLSAVQYHTARSQVFLRISSRKRFFQQNLFRLFIIDPNGFDSWKKIAKILRHCLFKHVACSIFGELVPTIIVYGKNKWRSIYIFIFSHSFF